MTGAGEVRVTSSTGGAKGKKPARFDLLPGEQLWRVAELYGRGAEKYTVRDEDGNVVEAGDNNWRKGYNWSLSFSALNRHLWQFWNGEWMDEENQAPHLASVVFHALALMEFYESHQEFDDRPVTVMQGPEHEKVVAKAEALSAFRRWVS